MTLEQVLLAIGPGDEGHVDALVDTVVDIAGPTGATVVLFYALSDEGYQTVLENLGVDPTSDQLSPTDLAARNRLIDRAIDRLTAADIDHDIRGAVGEPETAIVDEAADLPADLLVIGGRKRSPAGKAVFGSVPQAVLLSAPCPVVYVRRD